MIRYAKHQNINQTNRTSVTELERAAILGGLKFAEPGGDGYGLRVREHAP